jgi:hypothetical protein
MYNCIVSPPRTREERHLSPPFDFAVPPLYNKKRMWLGVTAGSFLLVE